jgi:peroxiredoxin
MSRNLATALLAFVVLSASALASAYKLMTGEPTGGQGRVGALVGLTSTAPRSLPPARMTDINGQEIANDELTRGRVLLVYLTTSCEPCAEQARIVSRLSESAPSGVRIYGVSFERPAQVATFVREFDLKYSMLIDPGGKLAHSLDIHYFPSAYLVEDGMITKAWRGVTRDEDDFRRQLLTGN